MKALLIIQCLLIMGVARSQTIFLKSGSIEFQRSINVHKIIETSDMDFIKSALPTMEKFYNTSFTLYFDSARTMYKPSAEVVPYSLSFAVGPAKANVIYTDYVRQQREGLKRIFEDNYIVQDSANKIKWRMTDEIRTIAGFDCRKAVGIICDSVYITAFYTDEIMTSGGPESFGGLPGMILGIAIPRLYTTWFAQKIVNRPPPPGEFTIPSKGKKIDYRKLEALLKSSMEDWGKAAHQNMWWSLL